MIYPEELVNLLKKHGFWRVSLFVFIVMCATIVLAIVFANVASLVNAMWCGICIFGNYVICKEKEEHHTTKEKLADAKDNLCISKHEVERLTLELETYKSAKQEKEAFPSAEVEKPKTKKPAPKRKPRPKTEKKNENNMD